MSQRIWGSGAAPAPESVVSSFTFRLANELVEWDWSSGPPPWRELQTMRKMKARALARHIPASPFCSTTRMHLQVESGLEHDLLRELDRRPEVSWLVTQPCRVVFANGKGHVPDMLEVNSSGVRLWDVRPQSRQDASFHEVSAQTEAACLSVGLMYDVYSDASAVRRSNLRWLNCYRTDEGFWPLQLVLRSVEAGRATTVGEMVDLFGGDLGVVATLWHLVWLGEMIVDLDDVIRDDSSIALRAES